MLRFPLLLSLAAAVAGGFVAHKKGRNEFVWGALCFFLPLFFFLLLFLPPQLARGVTRKCPNCGRVVYKGDGVCRYCKKELPIELVQCRECGSFVPEKDYCSQCHKRLKV